MRRILLLLIVLLLLGFVPHSVAAAPRCFAETGLCLDEAFREYWERGGGLAVFGLPVSGALWEDGRLVQYVERNRFELHPENPPAFRVLLGQLGVERIRASGRTWQNLQRGTPADGCLYFSETHHSLCGAFRNFWERNGGLAVFGFPIGEPATEPNEADGRSYTVQYFERNRFELHPENRPPYDVQLGLLGAVQANTLLGAARQPSLVRAEIAGPAGPVSPFDQVTLAVRAPGYDGPATLRLFDGAGQTEAQIDLTLVGGNASATLTAGGALGPHTAALLINGQAAGIASAAYTLDAQTSVVTGVLRYDSLVSRVQRLLAQDTFRLSLGGQDIYGYRSPDSPLLWLRDHVYQALGYRYFEPNMTSLLDYFRQAQRADGSFDDYVGGSDAQPVRGRMEVEADLEFLYTQGIIQAWQATGDDAWLRAALPAAERGLAYSLSDPKRWDAGFGLIKRPYTIDMWDFELGPLTVSPDGKPSLRHGIDGATRFGIMHGDNTGAAGAMLQLANAYTRLGDNGRAANWRGRAFELMQRLNSVSWNGSFYRHFVPLSPADVPGVDVTQQLSLSNAYALNRDVLNAEQATSILNTYQQRRRDGVLAEWYSIDPAFPSGSFGAANGLEPGQYVNGGVMPLVGGELARGAFHWGQERYGFDTLDKYNFLLNAYGGGSYLWYEPNGTAGKSNESTVNSDGWGSASMLAALIEGAAGVRDSGALLRDVELSPRWAAAPDVQQAAVTVRYPASQGYLAYRWERMPSGLRLRTTGAGSGTLRLLLPTDAADAPTVTQNGVPVAFRIDRVGASRYAVLALPPALAVVELKW